ncbi:hypothetical protein N7454_001913 [Penicillium verhagenii]|nr:hypothetical protein N7454_001913 [Penicillium verhagenii]
MDDIEDRLRSHAQAFDGLLSLIPAKYYYGEDTSDQWQRKKQTKEQAREAKRAKLDPEAAKTAKDIMDENARKRKRKEDGIVESDSSDGELGSEIPREGLSRGDKAKKQKQVEKPNAKSEEAEARKKEREQKKSEKKAAQKEKKKAKDAARNEKSKDDKPNGTATETSKKDAPKSNGDDDEAEESDNEDGDDLEEGVAEEGFSIDFDAGPEEPSSTSSRNSPEASNTQSGSSSISSIPKALKATPEDLKQRLQKRLDELRAKRHADGLNGKPARNRQELIEARRQKAEQRKVHKKELRAKAKEEEQRKDDEDMTRRFSPGGSGSLLASPRSPAESVGSASNNFSFGRVVFADGQHTDASLTNVRDAHKTAGPRDAAAQLQAVEAKKARLAGMNPDKRSDVEEKDRWLNAKKRAHGERVRDDTSLLKKALKRKESAKKKSAREWNDRIDTVAKMKDQRATKREENLKKRRDEKGTKGKGKKKSSGGAKKSRPGFEGSFKSKTGGANKKK